MLISELAEKTGLTSHTIRFYEKLGLFDKRYVQRGANNYRYYSEAAIERIRVIRSLQMVCFTLSEIKDLLESWDAGTLTPAEGMIYLQQKMGDIDRKIAEFEHIKVIMCQLSAQHPSVSDHSPEATQITED